MVTIVRSRVEPDICVLKLAGRLGIGLASQELQWQIEELMGKGEKKLVLDLADLKYMDSTGLGLVVYCSGKLREGGGHLYVAGANSTIQHLFEITHVDRALSLYATVEEAVTGLGSVASTKHPAAD